eukprot:CAMPEP_0201509172 /NCGR_PEP_ID=MMETSP0161_2-20130828/2289_1 /ASSEMBLY_ACC=CAM_ASM_000251 /TAXON_ID=180227 /ORGANISM="Neoparamoeba aestuarina, Strain SoJaBio B1-5/56/2" /LENGTH=431 /DNA_ID=CAMNT_0047904043 /DNA_START=210 /DNA_END=1505 /DNA_ORIENTATION=-
MWNRLPSTVQECVYAALQEDASFAELLKIKSLGLPDEVLTHAPSGARYANKASRGMVARCNDQSNFVGYIDVYRLGEIKSLPYLHGCTTYREFLETARKAFHDDNIQAFWFRDHTQAFLDNVVVPLPKRNYKQVLIATARLGTSWEGYKEQERYFFPALEVGEVVEITLPDSEGGTNTINMTTLSIHPKIFFLENYLDGTEADDLWHYMNNLPENSATNWETSSVGQDHSDKAENSRTRLSRTLWLGDVHKNQNPLTSKLYTRSQNLLHTPMELMEPFQCVDYPQGGHYYFHTDSVPPERQRGNPNPYYANGGNRYATLLIYVNAPTNGGHTAFPLAENNKFQFDKSISLEENPEEGCDPTKAFHVGVKKGAAVLFFDCLEEGHMRGIIDPLSEHAGCETDGEEHKVIMNQWYRNKRVKVGDKWHMYDNSW